MDVMGALATKILRGRVILSNCRKKLLGLWKNTTKHPQLQILRGP